MRRVILVGSLGLAILCFIYPFLSAGSTGVRIITTRDGQTKRLTNVRLCTVQPAWWDTRSGTYELIASNQKVELPRNFNGLTNFEIIEGCDGDGVSNPENRKYEAKKKHEDLVKLRSALEDAQKGSDPEKKRNIEIYKEQIKNLERESAEADNKALPLHIKVTYDDGEVIEGTPDKEIGRGTNYVSGYSDRRKVKIMLNTIVSVSKEK